VIPERTATLRVLLYACSVGALVCGTTATAELPQHSTSPSAPSAQARGRWTPRAPLPTPRLDAVAVENGGSIFVIGGIARSGGDERMTPDLRAVEEYNPVGDRWRQHKPAPFRALGAASIGNRIFVLGRRDLYEYDPARDEWRARAAMPTERGGFGVIAAGQRLLVIGGMVTDASRQWGWRNSAIVEEYDPSTDAWRSRAPMMTPRHRMAVTAIGNRVYVIGGAATHADDLDRDVDRVEVYDADGDRWSVAPRMPRGLAYFDGFVCGGRIVTLPGSSPQVGLQEYEPGTLRWRLVDDSAPPTARWRYAAAMAGGRVYIFGGVPRGAAADALGTTEAYDPQAEATAPR